MLLPLVLISPNENWHHSLLCLWSNFDVLKVFYTSSCNLKNLQAYIKEMLQNSSYIVSQDHFEMQSQHICPTQNLYFVLIGFSFTIWIDEHEHLLPFLPEKNICVRTCSTPPKFTTLVLTRGILMILWLSWLLHQKYHATPLLRSLHFLSSIEKFCWSA